MKALELIQKERTEQVEKHKRTVEYDREFNNRGQLAYAACELLIPDGSPKPEPPEGWDANIWENMCIKPRWRRLIIAGALILAERMRLSHSNLLHHSFDEIVDEINRLRPQYHQGDEIMCVDTDLLPDNTLAPPLVKGEVYVIKEIVLDKEGFQHLDVGLVSKLNFVTSHETKEELPRGNKIHWCHPSRFILIWSANLNKRK